MARTIPSRTIFRKLRSLTKDRSIRKPLSFLVDFLAVSSDHHIFRSWVIMEPFRTKMRRKTGSYSAPQHRRYPYIPILLASYATDCSKYDCNLLSISDSGRKNG